jgi:hypothetical protein
MGEVEPKGKIDKQLGIPSFPFSIHPLAVLARSSGGVGITILHTVSPPF